MITDTEYLSFPSANYSSVGKPWSLEPLLYKGGAGENIRRVYKNILDNAYGAKRDVRLPLLLKLHGVMAGDFAAGGSRYTIRGRIRLLKNFYSWADSVDCDLTESNVEEMYVGWTSHLLYKQRVLKSIKSNTAHNDSAVLGNLLNEALETYNIHRKSRTKTVKKSKRALSTKADKQVIDDTFTFGGFLSDICDSLSEPVIQGRPPFRLTFKDGRFIDDWANFTPAEVSLNNHWAKIKPSWRKRVLRRIEELHGDSTWNTRHQIINLRIEAELLTFIAQTGMNLEQARLMTLTKFRYSSHLDGYKVHRVYKSRAGREVAFEIFSEYRTVFDRYLTWRKTFFTADEERLFPIKSPRYNSIEAPSFTRIKSRCKTLGIRFVGPRELRSTRINWLIRKTHDTELTAEMAQHTQQVLIGVYQRPHHQSAAIEVTRFHRAKDRVLQSPGPGVCSKQDSPIIPSSLNQAITPDCVNPSGCLFCEYQRDVESFDHVWSLTTYKYYQSLLLSSHKAPQRPDSFHPAQLTIDRITKKIEGFRSASFACAEWCDEAETRILEADYHPHWEFFVKLLEVQ